MPSTETVCSVNTSKIRFVGLALKAGGGGEVCVKRFRSSAVAAIGTWAEPVLTLPSANIVGDDVRQFLPSTPAACLNHGVGAVSYTHLRAHETVLDLVCRLLLEKKKQQK